MFAAASPKENVDDLVTAGIVPKVGAAVVVAVDDDILPPNDTPEEADPKAGVEAGSLLPPPNENTPAGPLADFVVAPPKLNAAVDVDVTFEDVDVDVAVELPNANAGAAALVTAVFTVVPNENDDVFDADGATEAVGVCVVLSPPPNAKRGPVGLISAAEDFEEEMEKAGVSAGLRAVASVAFPKLKLGTGSVEDEIVSALVDVADFVAVMEPNTGRAAVGTAVVVSAAFSSVGFGSFAPKLKDVLAGVVDVAVEVFTAVVSVFVMDPDKLKETDKPLLTCGVTTDDTDVGDEIAPTEKAVDVVEVAEDKVTD